MHFFQSSNRFAYESKNQKSFIFLFYQFDSLLCDLSLNETRFRHRSALDFNPLNVLFIQ